MRFKRHNIIYLLRHLAFIVVVYAIVIQPVTQTVAFFGQTGQELADTDVKEDTKEEEKQEDDSKDEKIDLQNVSVYEYHFAYFERLSHFGKQRRMWDFSPEIPITPPEQV